MSASTHEILTALAKPFPADAVSWRVGQVAKGRDGDASPALGRALAYIDARDCEDRLDEVAGINWSTRHEIHVLTEAGKDQILCVCHISLLLETPMGWMWVSRSNGSGQTDYEGRKGAMSKAFVRAASAWGVGRFLYAIGSPKVKVLPFGKTWTIDRSEEPRLRGIVERAVRDFETNPRMRPLVDEGSAAAPPEPVDKQVRPSDHVSFQAPPTAPTPEPLLRRLRKIQECVRGEEALVALAEARQDRTIDPVAAEETFSRWLCVKAAAANTEAIFTQIEGALNRASLSGKLSRETRETIAQARKARGAGA